MKPLKILRLPEVKERVGREESSIYSMMAKGRFPRPVPVGERAVGWIEDEINEWIAARIAERDQKVRHDGR
jgi:prophage regulatory protein